MSASEGRKDKVITMIRMTGYIFDENDDLAPVMDAILRRIRSGSCDGTDDAEEWTGRASHRDMEDALRCMMPREREMIKKFFFEEKSVMDISIEMNMDLDLVGGHIRSAKEQIAIWI